MPRIPDLPADEVHAWFLDLQPPADRLATLERLLSEDEVVRANRFHFPEHRRRHVAAHGMLRELLAAYTGLEPTAVAFAVGPKGKPALGDAASAGGIHFNLAHSGDAALVGIARSELGVDIEVVRDDRDLVSIARRYFAPGERAAIEALPEPDRRDAFYRVWTRKEAYIKALGTGLSDGLDTFDVCAGLADDWSIVDASPRADLVGAIAIRGRDWREAAVSPAAFAGWLPPAGCQLARVLRKDY